MFAISPQPMIFTFQPSRPSPLSPRQTNACHRTRPLHSHMASAKEACTSTHHKRENKFKTLIKSKDTERSQRRELFLKKVKQVGDDRKWEARGDQVLRSDFITRQRQWEEEQARSAADVSAAPEEDEMDVEALNGERQEPDMIDELLSQERRELEGLLELMEQQGEQGLHRENVVTDYGSDDEDYNLLLEDALMQAEQNLAIELSNTQPHEDQGMDTAMG